MIDPREPLASWFLLVSCAFFVVVYGLPLVFAPLRWARWFRWTVPDGSPDLTVYFGRCTGLLALTIIVTVAPAIRDPRGHRAAFELIAWACGFMTLLHVWGAVRRIQPWTEHAEIVLYGAVCAAAVAFRVHLAR